MSRRFLHWTHNGEDQFTDAVAYYTPGSGEFLWRGFTYSKHYYELWYKNRSYEPVCSLFPVRGFDSVEFVELRDGEWADFMGMSGAIDIYHSTLRFPSLDKAWQYVREHPEETASGDKGGKWFTIVEAYRQLNRDFFRPERLRYDARPYSYPALTGVKKIGSNWQVEIKGADPPNRAVVILDKNFKLLSVTKYP